MPATYFRIAAEKTTGENYENPTNIIKTFA